MVLSSNLRRVTFLEPRDWSLGSREVINSDILCDSRRLKSYYDFCVKSIYFSQRENFKNWLEKKFSRNYSREMFNTFGKVFSIGNCNDFKDFLKILDSGRINERSLRNSFRVWLNFLEDRELASEEVISKMRNKVKLNISSNIDTYVPTGEEIWKSLPHLSSQYSMLYTLFLDSGARPSEIKHFIENFEEKKLEYHDDIVVYRNFHIRGSKNSYYLFFQRRTIEEFLSYKDEITTYIFNRFKEKISRNKEIINLKYLRKYHFTQMIKAGIDFEIADFIQGRSNKNIGFNHYLAKKEIALREYRKLNFRNRRHN